MMSDMTPHEVLTRFPALLDAVDTTLVALPGGLINRTWTVGDTHVLQRVNPLFGPGVNDDIAAITERLRHDKLPVPHLLSADTGQPYAIADGEVWRVMTRLMGRTVHSVSSAKQARSAANLVARFHHCLAKMDHQFSFSRPGAHHTAGHMQRLLEATSSEQSHRLFQKVAPLTEEIVRRWSNLRPAVALPQIIVHGDLKISNILFDEEDNAVGLIDLDTMAWSDVEVELGDALRSWCNATTEDAPDPELRLDIFEAACEGYAEVAGAQFAHDARLSVVRGLERITLELAARFATDALLETYFGWSPEIAQTRGDHNLMRACNQLELARQIAACRDTLVEIVLR